MQKMILSLGVVLALMLGVFAVAAQDDADIQPGDTIEGRLSSNTSFDSYTFSGTAGQGVIITLISSEFDAFLVLEDSAGNVIVEDDDSAGRLNARITTTLPEDDDYTIVATSLRAYRSGGQFTATGSYTLSLEFQDELPVPAVTALPPAPTPTLVAPTTVPPTTEPTPISLGATVEGLIEGLEPARYIFRGVEGDSVTITLVSDEFDAYLFLEDSTGNVLTQDDDSAGDLNSRISDFVLPESGAYIIIASSFGNVTGLSPEDGAFTLTLESASISPVPVDETPEAPEPDENPVLTEAGLFEGRLTEREPVRDFPYNGEAGEVLIITLTSDDFDAYLELLDSSGERIAFDDNSAGNLNSRIGPFILPADDEYIIRANSYGNVWGNYVETGLFLLSVDQVEISPITVGEPVDGVLETVDQIDAYRFSGQASDVIFVDLDTPSLDLYVEISGEGLLSQRTYGFDNGQLGPIILPAEADYVLTVVYSSYYGYDETIQQVDLPYTITVNRLEPQEAEYDSVIEGNFDETALNIYTFDAQQGDIINILLDSLGLVDTTITLTSPTGNEVAYDDESGPGFDPELRNVVLYETGTYTLTVRPYIPGDNADYRLVIENEGVRSLDNAPQILRISTKSYFDVVTFNAQAGETVRVVVRSVVMSQESEPIIIITQNDNLIAQNTIGTVSRLILEFDVPEDGKVLVEVSAYYDANIVLELSLERVEAE